jgi:hypothetical protein
MLKKWELILALESYVNSNSFELLLMMMIVYVILSDKVWYTSVSLESLRLELEDEANHYTGTEESLRSDFDVYSF